MDLVSRLTRSTIVTNINYIDSIIYIYLIELNKLDIIGTCKTFAVREIICDKEKNVKRDNVYYL